MNTEDSMSETERVPEGPKISMKEYQFTCSECGQGISVNETMRGAIEENGCPVCSAPVGSEDFGELNSTDS